MDIQNAIACISLGASEIISAPLLSQKLQQASEQKRSLRIKAGFDPTAPDLHLGHVVLLRKLRQFQDLGHVVFFVIGDFTAQIGDPSGREQTRVKMSLDQILENAKTYQKQVFKILTPPKTKIVFNSTWLKALNTQNMLELSAHCTVAQMLARADFKKRYDTQKEISLLEFIYPLLQGYDSIHLQADVEVGGSDQKFNLLMGRQIQEAFHQAPQAIVMMPLLEGLDGVQKMSKSLKNYIGIDEPPKEIFGKVMSISDQLMMRYYELLTDIDLVSVRKLHPKEAKLNLAQEIVRQFYTPLHAKKERECFEKVFAQRQIPEDTSCYALKNEKSQTLMEILLANHLVESKSEARRLISQGAVVLDGCKMTNEHQCIHAGVLRVGKRRFLKII